MIILDDVTKIYPHEDKAALDHVSLHIAPKEFVFLVGKSGAGKSTLIRLLTREIKPTSGKIIVGGIDYDVLKRRHIPRLRRRIGVVFQDFKLLPRRTVFENVAFALEIAGVSNREIKRTVPKVLELVGLADKADRFPKDLSGGERQRVSIARSMARQPHILIADEPTGNLDPENSAGIVQLLEEINNYGTTVLVTTHDEKIVNSLRRRVITLKDGRLIGDQKERGQYDLDASRTKIIKHPLNSNPAPRKIISRVSGALNIRRPAAKPIADSTPKKSIQKAPSSTVKIAKKPATVSRSARTATRFSNTTPVKKTTATRRFATVKSSTAKKVNRSRK